MEHWALDLLHSSDMRMCFSGGIADTDRPIKAVLADTDTGYWCQSQPNNC